MIPGYVKLHKGGLLAARVRLAWRLLNCCHFCGHRCGVDRLAGAQGRCRAGELAEVASFGLHPGEEDVLVGSRGSGTIFFARCTLNCSFCQNWDISQRPGHTVSTGELADMMLGLQSLGAANINLVSPTHYLVPILAALDLAAAAGLRLPVVWNSGGFDSPLALQLLAGVVDIWLPDMKFWDEEIAREITGAAGYPAVNQQAVARMHAQSGLLRVEAGVAVSGLIVRHLVLPGGLAGSEKLLPWLARNLGRQTAVNVMGQYYPCYRAGKDRRLARPVRAGEVKKVRDLAKELGLRLV